MLKIIALIILLPLGAFAGNDCQLSTSENQTSVECSEVHFTNQINSNNQQMDVEFADGFKASFNLNNNKLRVDLGDNEKIALSTSDLENIKCAAKFAEKHTPKNNSALIDFFASLPIEDSIENVILFGGEVPWPIVPPEEEGKSSSKNEK